MIVKVLTPLYKGSSTSMLLTMLLLLHLRVIVVTYEIRVFLKGAKKQVFSSILNFENVNTWEIREYDEQNDIPALIVMWLFFFHPTNHLFLKLNVVHFMC
jgi:hypothetical protein